MQPIDEERKGEESSDLEEDEAEEDEDEVEDEDELEDEDNEEDEDDEENEDKNENEVIEEEQEDEENSNDSPVPAVPNSTPPASPQPFLDGKELSASWELIAGCPISEHKKDEVAPIMQMEKNSGFVMRVFKSDKKLFPGKLSRIYAMAQAIMEDEEESDEEYNNGTAVPVQGSFRLQRCAFASAPLTRRGSMFFKCVHKDDDLITCKGKPNGARKNLNRE